MTLNFADKIIDKGIDLFVVIAGILIALGVSSYKDSQRSLKQWNTFANHFQVDVDRLGETFPEYIKFYKEKEHSAKDFIKKIEAGANQVEDLSKFVQMMGMIQIDYPNPLQYEALIQTGNEHLLNDIEKINWLGEFYYFEKITMLKTDIFSDHFIPEYKGLLKKYFQHDKDISPIRKEVLYVLHMYSRLITDLRQTYEKQEGVRKKVERLLKKA